MISHPSPGKCALSDFQPKLAGTARLMLVVVADPHGESPDSSTFRDASKLAGKRVERDAGRQKAIEDSPIIAGRAAFRAEAWPCTAPWHTPRAMSPSATSERSRSFIIAHQPSLVARGPTAGLAVPSQLRESQTDGRPGGEAGAGLSAGSGFVGTTRNGSMETQRCPPRVKRPRTSSCQVL